MQISYAQRILLCALRVAALMMVISASITADSQQAAPPAKSQSTQPTRRTTPGLQVPKATAPTAATVNAVAEPKTGEDLTLGGTKITVWRPTGTMPAPLVIFSHGFHGSSRQSVFLMKALADHGYLVIAPNHKDAYMFGGGLQAPSPSFTNVRLWTDKVYQDRGEDIHKLITDLKADPVWSKKIDFDKIGLAGHSLGGYTILGLAGAWRSWKLSEVKAVLALSPFCTPYVEGKTLGNISVPVMYQGGSLDFGITPFVRKPKGAFAQAHAPAWYIEFSRAGHFAWTDMNPQFQPDIVYYSETFFDKYLKGDKAADLTKKQPNTVTIRSK